MSEWVSRPWLGAWACHSSTASSETSCRILADVWVDHRTMVGGGVACQATAVGPPAVCGAGEMCDAMPERYGLSLQARSAW